MFAFIDVFKLLSNYTFVKDGSEYRFEKFSNNFIVMGIQGSAAAKPGKKYSCMVRFNDLIKPTNGWEIKEESHSRKEKVYDFLKEFLEKARGCLERKSWFSKKEKGNACFSQKYIQSLANTNLQSKTGSELLKWVEEDMVVLDGLCPQTPVVTAKIDEKQPFSGIPWRKAIYKELLNHDNEFASQIEKDYLRDEIVIRKNRDGDIFSFWKLGIEMYIKNHFSHYIQTGIPRGYRNIIDVDIKLLIPQADTQEIFSKLTTGKPRILYIEQENTIDGYFAIMYNEDRDKRAIKYILCRLVVPSGYFRRKGWFKTKSQPFHDYPGLLAGIRAGLREFAKKYKIYHRDWEPLAHMLDDTLLKDMLNDLEKYCEYLKKPGVSIPVLLLKLIDLGWDSKKKLFTQTFKHYKHLITFNSRQYQMVDDFIQLEYGIGKRNITFVHQELDDLTGRLEELAWESIEKNCPQAEELITGIFNVLLQFASNLPVVKSTFQKVDVLRVYCESIKDNEFLKVGFNLFRQASWTNNYQVLTPGMLDQIKALGSNYLKRKIQSPDDLSRMVRQNQVLISLAVRFQNNELDAFIELIIKFAGEVPGPIDECHKTIKALKSSDWDSQWFEKLKKIEYRPGLFDDNRHLLVFLHLFLEKNKDQTTNSIFNIFKEAILSLVEEKDAKYRIKSNLNILKDINLEVHENFRKAILKDILKKYKNYRITGQTLTKLREKSMPAVILAAAEDLRDQEYTSEEELSKILELKIRRKLNVLEKIKINKADIDQYKNFVLEHAKFFIKNEERLSRYLEVLTVVYGDQQKKVSTFEKLSKIRMSHSNVLDERFVQAAFNIFSDSNWEDNRISGALEQEIKKVFSRTFNDANLSNDDVKENLRILTVDLGFPLTDDERVTLDEKWREKIKIMIDRTYDKK